jgi:hypothetical protein
LTLDTPEPTNPKLVKVKSNLPIPPNYDKMGQSQSSHASNDQQTSSKEKYLSGSVRGRKSVTIKMNKPSPHGLRASLVSEPSVPDFDHTDVDHTSVVGEDEDDNYIEEEIEEIKEEVEEIKEEIEDDDSSYSEETDKENDDEEGKS